MRIKTAQRKPGPIRLFDEWGRQQWRTWLMLGAYTLFVVSVGALIHRNLNLTGLYRSVRGIPARIGKIRQAESATPDTISIELNSDGQHQLALQREQQLAGNALALSDDDYIPAMLVLEGESVPASVRLNSRNVRLAPERDEWSLCIRIEDKGDFLGMTQFSLRQNYAADSIYSWIYHRALQREEIPAPEHASVRVMLNGTDLGTCALDEHFESRLPPQDERPGAAIVRSSEIPSFPGLYPDSWQRNHGPVSENSSLPAAETDALPTTASQIDAGLPDDYQQAVTLLDRFRNGEAKTGEVFDLNKLATFFAITDLLGTLRDSAWHELRFYYDSSISRLAPIGFKSCKWDRTDRLSCMHELRANGEFSSDSFDGKHYARLFADPDFLKAYLAKLEYISHGNYVEKLFTDINNELERNLAVIYSEFPEFEFTTGDLYRNQRYIRSVLNPVRGLIAYLEHPLSDRLQLQLGNPHYLPTVVLDAVCGDWTLQPTQQNLTLTAKSESSVIPYQPLSFAVPKGMEWKDEMLLQLRVRYLVLGTSRVREAAVTDWPHMPVAELDTDPNHKAPNVEKFEFLIADEQQKQISVTPGEWTLAEDLIIPAGYQVRCPGGVTLNLTASTVVLSYSPWHFSGSEAAPVVITSADATGQGVVIMNAREQSSLTHVVFQNLGEPRRPGWSLTGAVTFHESPVVLNHCHFRANRSEDALNIVRSSFLMSQCLFSQTQGDALDADFCDGTVDSTTFKDIGNDCIDVSGSNVEIKAVRCVQAGDKGLSVGENSTAVARDVQIRHARVGLAIKDLSRFQGQQILLSDCQYGLVTLRKKPEFGPASCDLREFRMQSVQAPYLIESGSEVQVEGVPIQPNRENLKDELYDI